MKNNDKKPIPKTALRRDAAAWAVRLGLVAVAEIKPKVTVRVASNVDADRIFAVLEACGFTVVREIDEGEPPSRLAWAIGKLSSQYGLTERESEVLSGVLEGLDNQGIAQVLNVNRATVKWHLHNVLIKTGRKNREALLRAALQLGGALRRPRSG